VTPIIRTLAARFHGGRACTLRLEYRPDDPWAVHCEADIPGDQTIRWVMPRQAIASGVRSDYRTPGVQVVDDLANRKQVIIRTRRDTGWVAVVVARQALAGYLERTYAAVPAGTERMDMDAVARELAGGES
jgi:sporulation and cell division protein SsgA